VGGAGLVAGLPGIGMSRGAITFLALCGALRGTGISPNRAEEIVQRSVRNIDSDWAAAPRYDFKERDVVTKKDKRRTNTYEVLMIDGSPYRKMIAANGRPLSAGEAASEERKFQQEVSRRHNESPGARRNRISEYQRGRRQDNALLREMAEAFNYRLGGEETVDGHRCFVLHATPRPGYVPKSRETRVLTGMRGKLWIDEQTYQWVKVQAEVFRPVAFGLFIAHVEPGTVFTLEQQPVQGDLWLPSHFSMRVNARILVFPRQSTDDETYSEYRPAGPGDLETKAR
jgi:hypothetical protein